MNIPTSPVERRRMVYETILPDLDRRPFIGGEFMDSLSERVLPVSDPMTGQELASILSASPADVEAAVNAARSAFDEGWKESHPRTRAKYLYHLADLIERDLFQLALLESADTGKLYRGVLGWDIPNAAEVYRDSAGWADKLVGTVLPSSLGVEILTQREPIGVCAAIIPWNFPFACIAWKIAPALAAGCTVVVKSSERAPLSAQYLAKLVHDAGFPKGVINILSGMGETTGRDLVAHPHVDKITFTGSVATAQNILVTSLSRLPRVTFELGDKTPLVICEDADLDVAIKACVNAAFDVSGQSCCAGSRILVQNAIFEQVLEQMSAQAASRRLGDPFLDDTEQGPQIDLAHVAQIDQVVKEALSSGGRLITGGEPLGDAGQFYAPTLLTGLSNDMPINREEVFGPVCVVMPFETIDEAIHLANDCEFGLAAALWTRSGRTSEYFARKVRAGTCWINCYGHFDPVAPWGGRKLSGTGRELGFQGIEQFLETKTLIRAY